jgi:hypothetical protein
MDIGGESFEAFLNIEAHQSRLGEASRVIVVREGDAP